MRDEPRLVLSEDEARIERAMDALGGSERAGAPAALGERVFAASAPALRNGAARLEGRRGAGVRRGLAIAAGLAVIACVAAWALMRGAPGAAPTPVVADRAVEGAGSADGGVEAGAIETASIQAEVDALFAASSMLSTGLDAEIASIRMDAAALGLDLADPSAGGLGVGMADSLGGSWSGGSL